MDNKASKVSFIVLLIVLLAAFVALIRPFLLSAIFAAIIATICYPIYIFAVKRLKYRYLASFITTIFVFLCVIVPLSLITAMIVIKSTAAVNYISEQIQSGNISAALDNIDFWFSQKLSDYSNYVPAGFNIKSALLNILQSVGVIFYKYSPKLITAAAGVFGTVLLMVIFLFVFFAEGSSIYHSLLSLLPLKEEHKKIMAEEVRGVISGTFLGMILTSIAQGILIAIGFAIIKVSNPVFWGFVAVGVTLIPVLGGPLMYVSAAVSMLIRGDTGSAIFILIYGVLLVSSIDNFIKPLALRGKVHVNPLLLALSLIGGGLWLGASGIVLGPLIVVLMLAMIRIYKREFAPTSI